MGADAMGANPFEPFPTLETERLVLRAPVDADAELVFRIQSDPRVNRYLGRLPDVTVADSAARVAHMIAGVRDGTAIRWIVAVRGGDAVGTGGFWRWNRDHRWAEIGYDLLPDHWGRGLMPEAVRAMLGYGFGALGLHRVEANVDPDNAASVRLLAKVGFTREGLLRENWLHDGRFTHSAIYGLLAGEHRA
jgi:ribosomal-protein-alanine N-acetyltransferase